MDERKKGGGWRVGERCLVWGLIEIGLNKSISIDPVCVTFKQSREYFSLKRDKLITEKSCRSNLTKLLPFIFIVDEVHLQIIESSRKTQRSDIIFYLIKALFD